MKTWSWKLRNFSCAFVQLNARLPLALISRLSSFLMQLDEESKGQARLPANTRRLKEGRGLLGIFLLVSIKEDKDSFTLQSEIVQVLLWWLQAFPLRSVHLRNIWIPTEVHQGSVGDWKSALLDTKEGKPQEIRLASLAAPLCVCAELTWYLWLLKEGIAHRQGSHNCLFPTQESQIFSIATAQHWKVLNNEILRICLARSLP